MSFIIDGHNLIGALPDIELGQPDDEAQLLARLRSFRARTGGQALIVFFDSGDLPSRQGDPSSPGVQVQFSAPGQTADDAIVAYLAGRGQPGQYAVVTNDAGLAWRVRSAGASVVRASDFGAKLGPPARRTDQTQPDSALNPHDPAFADIYAGFIAASTAADRFGPPAAEQAPAWIERLYGDDVELAQRAAQWLGRYGGPAALAPLLDALTHEHGGVRAGALLALGDLGLPEAIPALLSRLQTDANSMVREAASQSLGRIGGAQAVAGLETAAQTDAKSKVRKAAAAAAAQIRARGKT